MRGIVISGTDTEVGKTFCGAQLASSLLDRGVGVGVYKPVSSGHDLDLPSDGEILKRAAQREEPIERINPQRFGAALAPPAAAALEAKQVDDRSIMEGANWWEDQCDFLIVEGAGGLLSPISDSATTLSLAKQLGFPILLVAADRLGVINHTRLSLLACRAENVPITCVWLNRIRESDNSVATNQTELKRLEPSTTIVTSSDAAAELILGSR